MDNQPQTRRSFFMMRQFLIALGLVTLAASTVRGQDRPNTLTQKEAAEGWMLLFDGKSLDGWETHGTGDWKVENGAMVCGGTTPNWIGTAASFSDFILKLEFLGPEKVNSGVFLRSQKEGQPLARIVFAQPCPKPYRFGPHDRVELRVVIRFAAKDLDGNQRFLQLGIPAFQMSFNEETEKSRLALASREAAARKHSR
jgi:3-keto-disaccharide hydrolase